MWVRRTQDNRGLGRRGSRPYQENSKFRTPMASSPQPSPPEEREKTRGWCRVILDLAGLDWTWVEFPHLTSSALPSINQRTTRDCRVPQAIIRRYALHIPSRSRSSVE